MKTILIFNNITCIDHSFICKYGNILGGSYLISVTLLVESPNEDFDIELQKYKIVNSLSQLDNKLWVCADSKTSVPYSIGDSTVTTENLKLQMPEKYFLVVDSNYSDLNELERKFGEHLENSLNNFGSEIKVFCKLSTKPVVFDSANGLTAFRYSSGLAGVDCHIACGRMAYFVLLDENYQPLPLSSYVDCSEKLTELSFDLGDTYFVNSKYCTSSGAETKIEYSNSDGYFSLQLNSKVVQLQKEATTKNICEYMNPKFDSFKKVGAKYLMITEGLSPSILTEL